MVLFKVLFSDIDLKFISGAASIFIPCYSASCPGEEFLAIHVPCWCTGITAACKTIKVCGALQCIVVAKACFIARQFCDAKHCANEKIIPSNIDIIYGYVVECKNVFYIVQNEFLHTHRQSHTLTQTVTHTHTHTHTGTHTCTQAHTHTHTQTNNCNSHCQ